jgi:predicted RecA/RadA family phage recombinase
MRRIAFSAAVVAVVAIAAVGAARVAYAQAPDHNQAHTQATPKNFSYEIKDGKRVPKSNRTTNADGSWREETRVGNCTTVKEGTAAGEVKITRKCD